MSKTNFKPPKNKNDLTGILAGIVKNKKISLFVDSANLYFASSVANLRIDYRQMYSWFKEKSELVTANYYTAYDPEDIKQEEFIQEMSQKGYNVVKKPIKTYGTTTKGNMDIELAVDAITQAKNYDILILISGDGDFTYLIQALELINKKVIVLGVGGFTSFELHQEASNYFFLNRISKVWQSNKKTTENSTADLVQPDNKITDKNIESYKSNKQKSDSKNDKINIEKKALDQSIDTKNGLKTTHNQKKPGKGSKLPVKVKLKKSQKDLPDTGAQIFI